MCCREAAGERRLGVYGQTEHQRVTEVQLYVYFPGGQ